MLYELVNNPKVTNLLAEPARIAEERAILSTKLETLKKAVKVLLRDPE